MAITVEECLQAALNLIIKQQTLESAIGQLQKEKEALEKEITVLKKTPSKENAFKK